MKKRETMHINFAKYFKVFILLSFFSLIFRVQVYAGSNIRDNELNTSADSLHIVHAQKKPVGKSASNDIVSPDRMNRKSDKKINNTDVNVTGSISVTTTNTIKGNVKANRNSRISIGNTTIGDLSYSKKPKVKEDINTILSPKVSSVNNENTTDTNNILGKEIYEKLLNIYSFQELLNFVRKCLESYLVESLKEGKLLSNPKGILFVNALHEAARKQMGNMYGKDSRKYILGDQALDMAFAFSEAISSGGNPMVAVKFAFDQSLKVYKTILNTKEQIGMIFSNIVRNINTKINVMLGVRNLYNHGKISRKSYLKFIDSQKGEIKQMRIDLHEASFSNFVGRALAKDAYKSLENSIDIYDSFVNRELNNVKSKKIYRNHS